MRILIKKKTDFTSLPLKIKTSPAGFKCRWRFQWKRVVDYCPLTGASIIADVLVHHYYTKQLVIKIKLNS